MRGPRACGSRRCLHRGKNVEDRPKCPHCTQPFTPHPHNSHTHSAVVSIKNRRRVQNHIGGMHACGMALAAESATGIVVGMNVPDSAIPLCKSMKVNFVRRCEGAWCLFLYCFR